MRHFNQISKIIKNQVVKNAQALAHKLKENGIDIVSGGTDNHLVLIKTDSVNMSGKDAEALLESVHITTNKNMVPKDTRSPFVTSGIRIGTPAITTRGMKEKHMEMIADWMTQVLKNPNDTKLHDQIKNEIISLCHDFPVYK
jgi:glycine hydroxymethyltransferase